MTTTSATDASQQAWLDATAFGQTATTEEADVNTDPLAQKQLFLELLVAQLKYQDPLNPADGTEFAAQLSQFTEVEQSLESNQHLEAILAALELQNAALQPVESQP